MNLQVCLLLLGVAFVASIPIDNGVEGEAEISCGPTSITINFNTQNAWEGKLYVKNQFGNGEPCVVSGDSNSRLGSIELGFEQCGVVRERSVSRLLLLMFQSVIMFHSVSAGTPWCVRVSDGHHVLPSHLHHQSRSCCSCPVLLHGGRQDRVHRNRGVAPHQCSGHFQCANADLQLHDSSDPRARIRPRCIRTRWTGSLASLGMRN